MRYPQNTVINRAIDRFAKNDQPTLLQWNQLRSLSQVQKNLIAYEAKAKKMTFEELINENHDPSRLARHMTVHGDPRPTPNCDCHAIVAGNDPRSVPLRAVFAWLQMRIDMPFNGTWLPRNTAASSLMPAYLRKAVPHSRIHRTGYYRWLGTLIDYNLIKDSQTLVRTLKDIRFKLETSSFPSYVMLKASELP